MALYVCAASSPDISTSEKYGFYVPYRRLRAYFQRARASPARTTRSGRENRGQKVMQAIDEKVGGRVLCLWSRIESCGNRNNVLSGLVSSLLHTNLTDVLVSEVEVLLLISCKTGGLSFPLPRPLCWLERMTRRAQQQCAIPTGKSMLESAQAAEDVPSVLATRSCLTLLTSTCSRKNRAPSRLESEFHCSTRGSRRPCTQPSIHASHDFFSSPAPFFLPFLSFFRLLRSRFLKLCMPVLHTSA